VYFLVLVLWKTNTHKHTPVLGYILLEFMEMRVYVCTRERDEKES